MHYFDTVAVNALMLHIDPSLPFRNDTLNPKLFEERAPRVPVVSRHAHIRELITIHVNSTHWDRYS